MAFIGNTPTTQAFTPAIDYFSGNASTTAFTLSRPVASVAQVQAVISNVPQNPGDAFTVSGNTITFTSAPPSGTNNIYVYYTSPITQVVTPSDGTVGTSQISSSLMLSQANGGTGTTTGYYGFKNRIINGAMVIDQRNAGASATPSTSGTTYCVDRFSVSVSQNSKCTVQQNAGSVTPPTGFSKYYGFTVGASANVTVGAGDYFVIQQRIEGNNLADMGFGAVGAATFTVSFWVRSSVTGTFGFALQNGGQTRSYATTYTINSANTWEQKTITIAGDTSGTWATDNTAGLICSWGLGVGSTYAIAAGSSWSTTSSPNGFGVTGTVQLIQTNSATFYITGVQLEKGSTATSFDYRPYGTELALCQRYYSVLTDLWGDTGSTSGWRYMCRYSFPVTMRTIPTVTLNSVTVNQINTPQANRTNTDGTHLYATTTATTTDAYWVVGNMTMAAEL